MDGSGAGSYRAEMLRQQFAAEMIVRHFRAAGAEDKLLAFCNEADLEPGLGIPFMWRKNFSCVSWSSERTTAKPPALSY